MADGVDVTVSGLSQFLAELQELPKRMQVSIAKGALATGASVIRKKAVDLAPINLGFDNELQQMIGRQAKKPQHPPGTLKRAIYQTRMPDKCTPVLEVWKVDVRVGKKQTRKGNALPDAYYAGWVERGHWTRVPKSTRKQHRQAVKEGMAAKFGARWVAAQPFMRPAFEQTKDEVIKAIEEYILKQLPIQTAAFQIIKGKT